MSLREELKPGQHTHTHIHTRNDGPECVSSRISVLIEAKAALDFDLSTCRSESVCVGKQRLIYRSGENTKDVFLRIKSKLLLKVRFLKADHQHEYNKQDCEGQVQPITDNNTLQYKDYGLLQFRV